MRGLAVRNNPIQQSNATGVQAIMSTFAGNVPAIAKLFAEADALRKQAGECAKAHLFDREDALHAQARELTQRARLIDPETRDGFLPEHWRAIDQLNATVQS